MNNNHSYKAIFDWLNQLVNYLIYTKLQLNSEFVNVLKHTLDYNNIWSGPNKAKQAQVMLQILEKTLYLILAIFLTIFDLYHTFTYHRYRYSL